MFKSNNKNSGKRCEICSNLTINTTEKREWRLNFTIVVLILQKRFWRLYGESISISMSHNILWNSFFQKEKKIERFYIIVFGILSKVVLKNWFFNGFCGDKNWKQKILYGFNLGYISIVMILVRTKWEFQEHLFTKSKGVYEDLS